MGEGGILITDSGVTLDADRIVCVFYRIKVLSQFFLKGFVYPIGRVKFMLIINSFPKGGTNLVAKLLDLNSYQEVTGYIASSSLIGKYQKIRSVIRGGWNPFNSVIVGVDFPVAIKASHVKRKLNKVKGKKYICCHCQYSDHLYYLFHSSGHKVVQIIRDPRDIALSHAHYVLKTSSHPLNSHYKSMKNFDECLLFSISGGLARNGLFLESIGERAKRIDGWLTKGRVLSIKFEELVGPLGGGGGEVQLECINRVLTFASMEKSKVEVNFIQEKLFGGQGRTFRRGQVGEWEKEFQDFHIEAFEAVSRGIVEKWGY